MDEFFSEGQQDYMNGNCQEDNPYLPADSGYLPEDEKWSAWNKGWLQAELEHNPGDS